MHKQKNEVQHSTTFTIWQLFNQLNFFSCHVQFQECTSKAHVRHVTKLCNFVAQLCWATKLPIWHGKVAQLLTHHAINMANRNHLYSLAIYRRIFELWLASLLFTCYSRVAYHLTRKYCNSIMTLVGILVSKVTEKNICCPIHSFNWVVQ